MSLKRLQIIALQAAAVSMAVLISSTEPASAATVTSNGNCTLSQVTADGANAANCFGATTNSSNDNGADFNTDEFEYESTDSFGAGLFGYTDWALFGKNDGAQAGPNDVFVQYESGDAWPDDEVPPTEALSGTWNVTSGSFASVTRYLVVVKTSSSWAAYLFNTNPLSESGTWDTSAFPGTNNDHALSHLSVYTSMAAIPVPAAGFLLIGALGGLVALRRRRKTA